MAVVKKGSMCLLSSAMSTANKGVDFFFKSWQQSKFDWIRLVFIKRNSGELCEIPYMVCNVFSFETLMVRSGKNDNLKSRF